MQSSTWQKNSHHNMALSCLSTSLCFCFFLKSHSGRMKSWVVTLIENTFGLLDINRKYIWANLGTNKTFSGWMCFMPMLGQKLLMQKKNVRVSSQSCLMVVFWSSFEICSSVCHCSKTGTNAVVPGWSRESDNGKKEVKCISNTQSKMNGPGCTGYAVFRKHASPVQLGRYTLMFPLFGWEPSY